MNETTTVEVEQVVLLPEEVIEKISPSEALKLYHFFKLATTNSTVASNLPVEDYMKIVALIRAGRYLQPDYDSCNVTFVASINAACDAFEIPKMYKIDLSNDDKIFLGEEVNSFKVNIVEETETEKSLKEDNVINFNNRNLIFNKEKSVDMSKLNIHQQQLIEDIDVIIEKCLPKLDGLTHSYKILSSGLIDLTLSTNGKFVASFYIDPNVIHANGFYIAANSIMGTVFIPFKKTDIITKVLAGTDTGDYLLSVDETRECQDFIFTNSNVYQYIDLSGEYKAVRKLSAEDYKSLGVNLDSILLAYHSYYGDLPRFRMANFVDVNNFKLISDDKVKSPLSTMTININGTTIELKNDDIIIVFENGMSTSCKKPGNNAPKLKEAEA